MVRFLFVQSEGLTNHLAVGNDAPNRLEGLVFGESHGEHLAELYGLVKVGGEDWGQADSCPITQRIWMVAVSSISQAVAVGRPIPRRVLTRLVLLAIMPVVDGGSSRRISVRRS